MDTLKQVRVRKISDGSNTGALDLRVMLLQATASTTQRIARGQVSLSGQLYWSEVTYEGARYQNKTNDEILQEYISSNSEIEANRIGSKLGSSLFKIIQNPWADGVPELRKYGEDPYYLNNGAYIDINWRKNLEISYEFDSYYVYGNGTASAPTRILIDSAIFLDGTSPSDLDVELPNFFELNYRTTGTASIDEFYGVTLSVIYTIESALAHAQNAALTVGFEQGTDDYVISISDSLQDFTLPKAGISRFTQNVSGYEYSDETLKEVNTPDYIIKSFYIVPNLLKQPSIDETEEEFERFWSFDTNSTPRYLSEFIIAVTNSLIPLSITYSYDVKDEVIVKNVIEKWINNLSTAYPSAKNYNLKLANPSFEFPRTELVNDYSPKKTFNESGRVFKWEQVGDNPNVFTPNPATGPSGSVLIPIPVGDPVELIKMNTVFPSNWVVKTDEPAPQFSIWVGDVEADIPVEGFVFSDEFDDLSGLAPEFIEESFVGQEEMVFEQQEYTDEQGNVSEEVKIQTEINIKQINDAPHEPVKLPDGGVKHKLDMIPGIFKGNGGMEIKCCQIDGKPVNVKIADSVLDLLEAAKKAGVKIRINSGFRPDYYPNVSAKSESGVSVSAQSQEELYKQNCKNGTCDPATAKPGNSKHGSGIAIDFNTGSRESVKFKPLNTEVYKWMIKNSWKFGFLRTVGSEEWHYEYWPEKAKSGPYGKLSNSNKQYWSDLGLNNLQSPNWS